MGQPKQLMLFENKPMVRHTVDVARSSDCSDVIVVLGSSAELIHPALTQSSATIIENARWHEGIGTSIQVGVEAAQRNESDAVIITLADLPHVTAQVLNHLMATHLATRLPIVASQYADTVGVPVLFSHEYFSHLLALKPDQGCKGVILSNADKALRIQCREAEIDIDTPDDYARLVPRPESGSFF